MKNLTSEVWLDAFVEYLGRLEATDQRLTHIASFENGFEDWLKFEMASLVRRAPWGYQSWQGLDRADVGVEYAATLKGGGGKEVDLWASPTAGANRWLFLELKVVFNNSNKGKQFRAWVSDFVSLKQIDGRKSLQHVAEVASIAFAVGFDDEELAKWTRKVLDEVAPALAVSWQRGVSLSDGRKLAALALISVA